MGKLNQFQIILDKPGGVYHPGEVLSGHVIVDLKEELKMREIRAKYQGYANVHWKERRTVKGAGGKRRRKTIHYRSRETYFDQQAVIFGKGLEIIARWGNLPISMVLRSEGSLKLEMRSLARTSKYVDNASVLSINKTGGQLRLKGLTKLDKPGKSEDLVLQPGSYKYPFSFTLPHGVPSSYEAKIGRVRYFIQVTIDRPWAFDNNTRTPFTVANLLDLNTRPDLLNGASAKDQKVLCCLCCASDPIIASLTIDRQGYVPGEAIVVNSDIDNQSDRAMSCSKARLIMQVKYHARGKTKTVRNCIHELQKGEIDGGSKDQWSNEKLFIPPVPPSYLQGCSIIDIRYLVIITVDPSGIGFDLDVPLEVVIGSIPFARIAQQYGEVVTQQPTAPPPPGAPEGLYTSSNIGQTPGLAMPNLPPSAYAESAFGRVNAAEEDDNEHTQGNLNFAPVYTYYKWEKKDPASNFTVKLDEKDEDSGDDSD